MSIENEIRDLTIAINTLAYAIMQRPVPTQADIVQLSEELQEVVEILPVVEPTPEPAKEMSDEEALAIVSKSKPAKSEPVAVAPTVLSRQELQSWCTKIIRANRDAKDVLVKWIKDHGAENLLGLDDKFLSDFQAYMSDVEDQYVKTR